MTWLAYGLMALGAYRVIRRTVIIARTLYSDLHAKPTPWLGGPMGRGPLNGH